MLNRSWVTIGVACRHAIGLGLHLHNMHPKTNARLKEKRICVWWSLYCLDYLLCEITGRPTAIDRRFYSTPHPAPIDEADLVNPPGLALLEAWNRIQGVSETTSSTDDKRNALDLGANTNSASHFRCHVQLAILSQKVLVSFYSAETVTKPWRCAQEEMLALREELDQWYRSLPTQYQFTHSTGNETFCRERTQLAFSYYSARILLNRPCLCRVAERIQQQGDWSKNADAARASECIMAAKSISDLLPDMAIPDVVWIYTNGPWWCIVHHLMQAITVLMLGLALEPYHTTDSAIGQEKMLQIAQKLICWLALMASKGNESAISACKQAEVQFKGFAHFEKIDASNLVQTAKQGSDLSRQHFASKAETMPSSQSNNSQETQQGPFLPEEVTKLGGDGRVRPRTEQTAPTPELEHAEDHSIGNISTEQSQGMDLGNGSGFEQESERPWAQHPDDQSWYQMWWNPDADSILNFAVLQTPYDLSNPFTTFNHSIAPGLTTSDSEHLYRQDMTGITGGASASSTTSANPLRTTGNAHVATRTEAEQL